jgi:hypothetical protein
MTRRKALVAREPNGRAKRTPSEIMSPTESRRLMDAAKSGLKDKVWGTPLGWLHVSGKLNSTQFAAGLRWSELVADYAKAMQGPKPPQSARLAPEGGTPVDPDSPTGLREARRHSQIVHQYLGAISVLKHASGHVRNAVREVCELRQMPTGEDQLRALGTGLNVLTVWWSAGGKRK